jgi:hypothetical protein
MPSPQTKLNEVYDMTTRDNFQIEANELMVELNDATSAMMGMVTSHQTTGAVWDAAARRQSRSFGRWSSFLKQSDRYGQMLV